MLPARWPPYDPGMDLRIATIAERPAMKSGFVSKETEPWPAFMNEDPIALLYFSDVRIAHPEYGLIAYDAGTPDQAVARAFCVPFAWDGDPALGELPVDGWDGVIWRSARSPDRAEAEPGLGAGDHRPRGPAGHRPVREDAGSDAGQRETPRVQGPGRPRAAEPQAPGPGHAPPFDESGPVVVPGALVPVQCSVEHDYAVYVEPAVWVHHRL